MYSEVEGSRCIHDACIAVYWGLYRCGRRGDTCIALALRCIGVRSLDTCLNTSRYITIQCIEIKLSQNVESTLSPSYPGRIRPRPCRTHAAAPAGEAGGGSGKGGAVGWAVGGGEGIGGGRRVCVCVRVNQTY